MNQRPAHPFADARGQVGQREEIAVRFHPDVDVLAGWHALFVRELALPASDREHEQVPELLFAGVSKEEIGFGAVAHCDLQWCFEIGHAAIEEELLVFRRLSRLRRIDADKAGVRFARGEVMVAGRVGRNRQVGMLGRRQDTDLSPMNARVRDALLSKQRSQRDSRHHSGLLHQSVESRGHFVGWKR